MRACEELLAEIGVEEGLDVVVLEEGTDELLAAVVNIAFTSSRRWLRYGSGNAAAWQQHGNGIASAWQGRVMMMIMPLSLSLNSDSFRVLYLSLSPARMMMMIMSLSFP